MSNALITIVAPLGLVRSRTAEAAIERWAIRPADRDRAGARPPEQRTHFASLHAIRSSDGTRGYIVLEFSADGTDDKALAASSTRSASICGRSSCWRATGATAVGCRLHEGASGRRWRRLVRQSRRCLCRHARHDGRAHPARIEARRRIGALAAQTRTCMHGARGSRAAELATDPTSSDRRSRRPRRRPSSRPRRPHSPSSSRLFRQALSVAVLAHCCWRALYVVSLTAPWSTVTARASAPSCRRCDRALWTGFWFVGDRLDRAGVALRPACARRRTPTRSRNALRRAE